MYPVIAYLSASRDHDGNTCFALYCAIPAVEYLQKKPNTTHSPLQIAAVRTKELTTSVRSTSQRRDARVRDGIPSPLTTTVSPTTGSTRRGAYRRPKTTVETLRHQNNSLSGATLLTWPCPGNTVMCPSVPVSLHGHIFELA